ncbi:hypothetical protein FO519_005928, partial [Halicephalobus sp. NKZ332]
RIVVVTVANETDITFHVLQVEKNGLIRMIFYSDSKYPESLGELVSVNFEYGPSFLVFLASNQNKIIRKAEEMRKFVQKGIILTYDRWDHMLNEGGLFKAHELIKLTTDRSCNLANFSDGIFVDFGKKSSQMVLKPGQPLPLRGTVTKKLTSGITVNAFFYADIVDVYKEIKLTSKNAMPQMSGLSNSHFRIEISVDEFGIPTASSAILTEDDLRKEFLTQRYIVVCSLFTGDVRICNQTRQDQRTFKMTLDKSSMLSAKDVKSRCQQLLTTIPQNISLAFVVFVQDEPIDGTYMRALEAKTEKCLNVPILAAKLYYSLSMLFTPVGRDVAIIIKDDSGMKLYIFTKRPFNFELIYWRPLKPDEKLCRRSLGIYTEAVGLFNFTWRKPGVTFSRGLREILKEYNVDEPGRALVTGAMIPQITNGFRIQWNGFKKDLFNVEDNRKSEHYLFNNGLWPKVTFELNYDSISVIIFKNDDVIERVPDVNGMYETPMYISFPEDKVTRIGEVAKRDFQKMPESVAFGIMHMVGLPLSRIRVSPEWKFKLLNDPKSTEGSRVLIKVKVDESKTFRSFKTEWFLASFLVAALKQAINKIGVVTTEVAIIVPRDFKMEPNEEKNGTEMKSFNEKTTLDGFGNSNMEDFKSPSISEPPTQKEHQTQDTEFRSEVINNPVSNPETTYDTISDSEVSFDEKKIKKVSFFPNVRTINLEKRPKWERFRGLSVGEFLREIEYEEEFDDQEIQNDEEALKFSMTALGPIQEDDETEE